MFIYVRTDVFKHIPTFVILDIYIYICIYRFNYIYMFLILIRTHILVYRYHISKPFLFPESAGDSRIGRKVCSLWSFRRDGTHRGEVWHCNPRVGLGIRVGYWEVEAERMKIGTQLV